MLLFLFSVHLIGVVVLLGATVAVVTHEIWKFPRLNHTAVLFFVPVVLLLLVLADTITLYLLQQPPKDDSVVQLEPRNAFGLFEKEQLVAASHYTPFADGIVSLGILTHPAHRRKGYSTIAASAAAALKNVEMIHFQTIIENAGAIAVSRRLGCRPFGYSCKIELNERAG